MEHLQVLLSVFVAQLLLMISPGPNVLLVSQVSASQSRRAGLQVALGIATAGFIWPCLALFGLSVVFEQVLWLYLVLM